MVPRTEKGVKGEKGKNRSEAVLDAILNCYLAP